MRVVDLSQPVVEHFRYRASLERTSDVARGDLATASRLCLGTHAYTHVDAPSHMIEGAPTLDQVPLDRFWGEAEVADLSGVPDATAITAADLERALPGLREGDVALLRTSLELRADWRSQEFWDRSPWLERSAAAWLVERRVRAVGYDFPQDRPIRNLAGGGVTLADMPVHDLHLRAGITQVEYLRNLHLLDGRRGLFFALPLSLPGADGSPCRAFALLED